MKLKKIFVIMAIATLIISFGLATVSATTDVKNEKKDTGISIESKEKKVSSYKIKWDANGGKIGTKKTKVTSIKKGSKIGKLVATPKRSGFTFQGWYTKKNGGKKISKNTKPTKSVAYFARWTKKSSSRVLNAEEKKLVGEWKLRWDKSSGYKFNADGTYLLVRSLQSYDAGFKGYYSVKNGVLTKQYQHAKDYTGVGFNSKSIVWSDWGTDKENIKFVTIDGKLCLVLGNGGVANTFVKD